MGFNIKALRQKRVTLNGKMQTILDVAKSAGRELNEEENARFNILRTEGAHLALEIDEAEQELDREREMEPAGKALSTTRVSWGGGSARSSRPKGGGEQTYAQIFGASFDNRGFDSFNEFLESIHSGRHDPRLQATASMTGTVPSDGGFLIPTSFAAEMLDVSLESEIVRPRARVVPMSAPTRRIAGFDSLDHTGGVTFGGFKIGWIGETDALPGGQAKTRLITLTAHKLALFCMASNELVADGMSFEEMLGSALIASVGWGLDNAFLQGDGAGKPLGVLNDPALITVAKESGQAAGTILYSNVVKMFARLHPACVKNSVWVCNSTAIPQLLKMTLNVMNIAGTENVGGSAVPIVSQDNGVFSMLTRPMIFTEKLPAVGTLGDILLCDFSQYSIGIRKEVSVEKSISLGWGTDEAAYRSIMRVDGQGRWNTPLKPQNGDTLSWCIALATRS